MNEDLHSWFQGLCYEKEFGYREVPSSEVRKKQINTYAIVSAVNRDMKEIFGEDKVL